MLPTISDVAREARVGIGTVSRVLNASPGVAEATRQRVLAVMERVGYRPNPIARALGGGRTHTLEVLVPRFAETFFFELVAGIEDSLAHSQYRLRIRLMGDPAERDRAFEACGLPGQADGALLIWTPPSDALVQRLAERNIPVVLLNAVHDGLTTVGVDHDAAAARAVKYCAGLGHRRIALIDRLQDPFADRGPRVCQAGYRDALMEASLDAPEAYERLARMDPRGGAAAMEALLALDERPTAVIVGSAPQAVGALTAARLAGRHVPRDVSLVGYNDSDVAGFLGLTTVQVPLRELGRRATQALLAMLGDAGPQPTTTYLDTWLVVRGTCAPPRA